jgi:acyl dehydratase
MVGLVFEEFEVGKSFEHAWSRTITEMDHMLFSCLTLNVQPLHIDAEFASKTEYGKPLFNSLFTLGLLVGIIDRYGFVNLPRMRRQDGK